MITNVAMIASSSSHINDYFLDLFFLGVILIIDIIYVIAECIHYCRNRDKSQSEVVPENSQDGIDEKHKKYDAALEDLDNFGDSRGSNE